MRSQANRSDAYAAALAELQRLGVVYACACTRREIADSTMGHGGAPIYPGTCRAGVPPGKVPRAWRVDTRGVQVSIDDRLQGHVHQDLEGEAGDFIVQRADGIFAYQLAAVVDDAELGVSDIVRGADLLDSTLRQVYLQGLLGLAAPRYLHLPVAVNALGEKLSKQTLAPALETRHPQATLIQALRFLNHAPPQALQGAPVQDLLTWAIANWSLARLPQVRSCEPQI